MDIILYNPLSSNGNNLRLVNKLTRKLTKQGITVKEYDLTAIPDLKKFIQKRQTINRFIIIGGDGTISRFANSIQNIYIKPGLFIYKAGTGNDFIRSLERRRGLIDIKRYLVNLPRVKVDREDLIFLNGVGLGLDGLTCHKVNNSRHNKNKFNYFRHALEAFNQFKPQDCIVTINKDKVLKVKDALFVSVMNSKFFGGGMKIAPKANRLNDDLQVVVISKVPKPMLLILIPLLYLGLHVGFKKYVKIYSAKEVLVSFTKGEYMQIDGEDYKDIKEIKVTKR